MTAWVLIVLSGGISFAQNSSDERVHEVQVFPSRITEEKATRYKPGLFYHRFWEPIGNTVFRAASTPGMYNTLRETKFYSECWRWSTSREDMVARMQSTGLRDWLSSLRSWTDRVVVKINGMPWWLSSNSSTQSLNDNSWKEFMTHPPHDWTEWEDAVETAVAVIASWGIHPWYEIWNEPDGEYWKGSDDDLLELYRRTALAIARTDPEARIGGPGMHTWWRSVDPVNSSAQQPYMGALFGHIPDVLPERYSFLYRLLDSVRNRWAEQEVPLDFISYHHFNHNRAAIGQVAAQLRAKMIALGYCPPQQACPEGRHFPELYISEWQTTYGAQEQLFQPPLFLAMIREMADAGIRMHSIAANADFSSDPEDEFTRGWGMMSGSSLVKPVYRALQLLDDVTRHGSTIDVDAGDLLSWASMASDTLRLLVAHYSMPTVWYSQYVKAGWSAYERLLYSANHNLTRFDFEQAGHQSLYWGHGDWGSIDRIFRGEIAPFPASRPEMMAAFAEARAQYVRDSIDNAGRHLLRFHIPMEQDTLIASVLRIDSTRNNIIARYDSLRASGVSSEAALDSLRSFTYPGGYYGLLWETESVPVVNGEMQLEVDPNTVCYLRVAGVMQTTRIAEMVRPTTRLDVFPQPARGSFTYHVHAADSDVRLILCDALGRRVASATGDFGTMRCEGIPPGPYLLLAVLKDGKTFSRHIIMR